MLWLTKSTVRPPAATLAHSPERFLLKLRVADCEHFIDDQDLRLQMSRHREGQTNIHP